MLKTRNCICPTGDMILAACSDFLAEIGRLRAENERLRSQVTQYKHMCRYEWIRQQDRTIRELQEELDALRAKNEALRAELRGTIPVDAVRSIVVEAIRDATGCPDIKGQDGEYLVDKIEALARAIACA